jgi:transposase
VALQPLADQLSELLSERSCLHADETRVRQLGPGSGKTKRAHLWANRAAALDDGPSVVVFYCHTSPAGAHARAFLEDWRGHLMVDDCAAYKALLTAGPIEFACLAHIRRKVFEVHAEKGSPVAAEASRRIAQLYAIEPQSTGMTSGQRLALREQHASLLWVPPARLVAGHSVHRRRW